MKCPKYVEVNNRRYKINTSFRNAIECNRIAQDETIGDYERALAIIYILFGEEGLSNQDDYEKLLELAKRYLTLGEDIKDTNEDPDMDFNEDYDYIVASFQSDYGINLDEEEMDWYRFFNLLNGLSNSELGNCCVLNRIRNLRNFNLKDIKDPKEREKMRKAKEQVALKRNKTKKVNATNEQQENALKLYKALGFDIERE